MSALDTSISRTVGTVNPSCGHVSRHSRIHNREPTGDRSEKECPDNISSSAAIHAGWRARLSVVVLSLCFWWARGCMVRSASPEVYCIRFAQFALCIINPGQLQDCRSVGMRILAAVGKGAFNNHIALLSPSVSAGRSVLKFELNRVFNR